MPNQPFNGFSKKSLRFLTTVKAKNDKEWFIDHKREYERDLLEPLRSLVRGLGPSMLTIDPNFEITPSVNKTISRLYRDTRFSKDQSLFRDRMWITFKTRKDWQGHPGFFFEIAPDGYRYGMDYYRASPGTMKQLRERIDEHPKEFSKILSLFSKQKTFVVEGENYKRLFDPTKPDAIQNFYQRKNIYFVCNREIDDILFSEKLVKRMITAFNLLDPIYWYFMKLN